MNSAADVVKPTDGDEFINKVVRPINAQDGDLLPVSAFKAIEDGTWPAGTAKFEKRGVSAFVPVWNAENCIQCNKCAYVCPHACIRPFVLDENEVKGLNAATIEMKAPAAMKGMHFRIQVGVMDCLGCGNCVDVCPGNPKLGKALLAINSEDENATFISQDWLMNSKQAEYDSPTMNKTTRLSKTCPNIFIAKGRLLRVRTQ